jgi:hypothetical protein
MSRAPKRMDWFMYLQQTIIQAWDDQLVVIPQYDTKPYVPEKGGER